MYWGWMTTYTPSHWVVRSIPHGECNGRWGSTKVNGRRGLLQLNSLFYKVHTCTVQCLTQCAWRSSQLGRELKNRLRAYQIGKWLMLSMISDKILIKTRIDRSQNQHTLSTEISTATKTNICSVLQYQPPPKPTYAWYCNVNRHQSQHRTSTRSSGTSSRILVIIQIFCRSINTPSSGPTAPSFWMW